MDVVDQSVYLRAVGKTYVDQFTIYSERTFLRLHPPRQNRVKMLQNFGDGDVDVCVNPANPDCAVCARQPTGHCDRKMPRLCLSNCRWRAFLRLELHRARPKTANGCHHCSREEKESYPHEPILCSSVPKSQKNL